MFFKCEEMSLNTAFTVKSALIFLEYIFEFLMNTAPLASNSVYRQNFGGEKFGGNNLIEVFDTWWYDALV